MNRFEFYDSIREFKVNKSDNSLAHMKSPLFGTSKENVKYYKREGKPGSYRYYYSKEEYEAAKKGEEYQKFLDNKKKETEKKETERKTKEGSNFNGNDYQKFLDNKKSDQKNKESSNFNGDDYQKFLDNKKLHKKIDEVSDLDNEKYDRDEAIKLLKQTQEAEILKKSMMDFLDKKYSIKNKTVKGVYDLINEYFDYPEDGADDIYNNFKKLGKNSTINSLALYDICDEVYNYGYEKKIQYIEKKYNTEHATELRDAEIKKNQKTSHESIINHYLASDNPNDILNAASMQLNDYFDYVDNDYKTEGNDEKVLEEYKNFMNSMSTLRQKELKDPENGIPLLPREMTIDETMRYVNPGRRSGIEEIMNRDNCSLCTLAMDLRMRGYDVSAANFEEAYELGYDNVSGIKDKKPKTVMDLYYRLGYSMYDVTDSSYYNNLYKGTAKTITNENSEELKEIISRQTNSWGDFTVGWNDAKYGHSMFYKVDSKGNIEIYDAQTNKKVDLDEIMSRSHGWSFTRTDHLEPNWEYIKEKKCTVYQ